MTEAQVHRPGSNPLIQNGLPPVRGFTRAFGQVANCGKFALCNFFSITGFYSQGAILR
jgi:hypothetical protein